MVLNGIIRKFSSFTYLNATQFLGALNDNIYKLLIVYLFIQIEGIEYSHQILAVTGAIFVLPFILFSASSGILADRFSKRNIIVLTKLLEMSIMSLGIIAFYYESKIGSYGILFLLATQCAIFSPSKYGILPEIMPQEKITKANGIMTSSTFLAIILGTFLASFLIDITGRDFILAAICCLIIAIAGLITSYCIEYTPPADSTKKLDTHFLSDIFKTLKKQRQKPSLLMAIFGSAFFLFLGAFAQLNMIPYAVQVLHLTDVQGGYLFLLTAIGIGTGAMMAGKISGKSVELGLVPLAGLGVVLSSFALDFFSDHLYFVIPLVVSLGFFGGMYQIPLDSFIQITSPKNSRGQVVAATNFLSFCGVLCASALLYLITEVFNLNPDKGFTIIGWITLGMTTLIAFQYFDYLTRFIGMIFSRLHFQVTYENQSQLPDTPAIYVCTHTAWNDTLLMLGAQRRRLRFFIEQEQDHSACMRRLYRLLRVVMIPAIEPLDKSRLCITVIKNTLNKGISVCIFFENSDISSEIEKLKKSYFFQEILEETPYPIIPVIIEKGEKHKQTRFFTRLFNKFHVPATLSFGEKESGHKSLPENEASSDEEASETEHRFCYDN